MFQTICLCVWKLEWTRLAYGVRNWEKNFWILCSLHLQQGFINLVNGNFFNNKFHIIIDIIIGNSCRKKWLKHWLNIKFSLEINHFFSGSMFVHCIDVDILIMPWNPKIGGCLCVRNTVYENTLMIKWIFSRVFSIKQMKISWLTTSFGKKAWCICCTRRFCRLCLTFAFRKSVQRPTEKTQSSLYVRKWMKRDK